MTELLFAYGTLKDLTRPVTAVVAGELRDRQDAAVARFNLAGAVHGQVQEWTPEDLAKQDVAEKGYSRIKVMVQGGPEVWAYQYEGLDFLEYPMLPGGVWLKGISTPAAPAMSPAVKAALEEVAKHGPRWAYAVLSKAFRVDPPPVYEQSPLGEAPGLEQLWSWAKARLPLEVMPFGPDSDVLRVDSRAQLRAATRWASDQPGSAGILVKGADGQSCSLAKSAASVGAIVPTMSPKRPIVAFVGGNPNPLDAARGEPFTGPDGRVFMDQYLEPLGLSKADVMMTHLVPVAGEVAAHELVEWVGWVRGEIETHRPRLVVALGKLAKAELGSLAEFMLPHPALIRRRHDTGELVRKLRVIKERIDALQALTRSVGIAKSEGEEQIIYGVVLDPYIVDSQDDWISPADIQKTAHDYMRNSRVVGLQHSKAADAEIVESHIVHYPSDADYQAAKAGQPHRAFAMQYGNQKVHSGSWILGTKINDAETWRKIQEGAITSYSIGGDGVRTPMDATRAMPEVTFIDV